MCRLGCIALPYAPIHGPYIQNSAYLDFWHFTFWAFSSFWGHARSSNRSCTPLPLFVVEECFNALKVHGSVARHSRRNVRNYGLVGASCPGSRGAALICVRRRHMRENTYIALSKHYACVLVKRAIEATSISKILQRIKTRNRCVAQNQISG